MENVKPQTVKAPRNFKETLAYDEKGNPVVLRQTRNFKVLETEQTAPSKEVTFNAELRNPLNGARAMGSMKMFGKFDQFKAKMLNKAS